MRMRDLTLYHNPHCSKSRATLALLEENGAAPEIIYYMDNPLDAETLRGLLDKLGLNVRAIARHNEPAFEQHGLGDESLSEAIIFDIILKHPALIQRPIVVRGNRALIARPPERVLELLD